MKFFTVLLLASLAATSLAAPHEPKDEVPTETQHTDAPTQITQTSHSRKDHISNEVLSKEPFIFREELISEDNVVIQATRPKSHKTQQQQEDRFQNAEQPSEKLTEFIPRPGRNQGTGESSWRGIKQKRAGVENSLDRAATSEGKITKMAREIRKELQGLVNASTNILSPRPNGKNVQEVLG
ncbi:PREDICTED: glycosylation-dependent cell adhesion molecule 1-like [Dipodomys ordii]|uniref:Glycosylation-dependent cell adhesion molecule 1 n=1 Tax=Dipodomys ordii TaxID=10020 RepID=A0A1S3GGF4_DIPOR|nr:PREDICTED: glycosylation-dependent cell adhesion molecule 1-like [Dipodomys ordii]